MASRAEYQRRLCELEWELSQLRNERDGLHYKLEGMESALKHFSESFEHAPVGCVTLDELGKLVEFNETFSRMVDMRGAKPEERFFGRFLAAGSVSRFLDHLMRASRSDRPLTYETCLKSGGEMLPVELTSRRLSDTRHPSQKLVQTMVLDISQRLKAEDARAKRQSDFRLLVDTIQGVVWEAEPVSLILSYVSSRAEQILGYPAGYWTEGVSWESHVYFEDRERVVSAMRRLGQEQKDITLEYRMIRANREVIWVHNSISAVAFSQRTRLFGVIVDITDRKLTEEQLRMAREQLEQRVNERTAALRETVHDLEAFSYSLSHDLRAPLRAMQGYAQLLLTRFGDKLDETGRAYFQRLMNSTERLDRLIQDVLRYSKVARAPVELGPVNLEQLLDQVVNDYPVLLPPRVNIEVERPLLPVRGHEAFLTQCMSNLISNAAKFNRPGQTPHVKISTQELKLGKVRVWFEDNGIGIAPEDQRRIFGIFERVHASKDYEGTGIGLAIVAKAVERMGGHVGVESAVGRGSRFWLDLEGAQH